MARRKSKKSKKPKLTSAEYTEAIRVFGKFKGRGFSVSKDRNGYYIHTNRCRSSSYPTMRSIPISIRRYIQSTN